MDNVNNGDTADLSLAGVHDGRVGSQAPSAAEIAAFGATVAVAFRPNLSKAKARAGMIAQLDGVSHEVRQVAPSRFASGFLRILLAPVGGL